MVWWVEVEKEKNMTEEAVAALIFYEDDFLFQKKSSVNGVLFRIFDTSHSLFPEGDYQPMQDTSKFKLLGSYQFSTTDKESFKKFLESLSRKKILPRNYVDKQDEQGNEQLRNFFVLGKNKNSEEPQKIPNPYDYKFLKLHVSSSSSISQRKMEEFVSELKDEDFHKSNNKVYINNWVHIFLSIDKPYNFDGLSINEVEYDTSVFLQFDSYDDTIKSNWYAIQAGLMSARH